MASERHVGRQSCLAVTHCRGSSQLSARALSCVSKRQKRDSERKNVGHPRLRGCPTFFELDHSFAQVPTRATSAILTASVHAKLGSEQLCCVWNKQSGNRPCGGVRVQGVDICLACKNFCSALAVDQVAVESGLQRGDGVCDME